MEYIFDPVRFRRAHANFRKGLCDYNDGSSLNHNLGNDDYHFGNNEADPYQDDIPFDGHVAYGNNLLEDDEYEEEEYEELEEDHNRA